MRIRTLVPMLLAATMMTSAFADTAITGAGATFPAPIYGKWAEKYAQKTQVKVNYQSIGSGGGIKQIEAGTVDFGASDKPLKDEDLKTNGLLQFPTVLGAVVPVVNLEGVKPGELKLTGPVLADIYLGTITKWSDPQIKKLNPNVNLPDTTITVVHRSDGSGTTFIFTNYLGKVKPEWLTKVGNDASVNWPVGLGGKGNEGVASYVKQTPNSIGYVEYAYAVENKLSHTLLQNKANQYPTPSIESIKAAAVSADWAHPTNMMTNASGEKSWPIAASTFILVHTAVADDKKDNMKQVLEFFDWAYHNGEKEATALNFAMLPDEVIKKIEAQWKTTLKDSKGEALWTK